jgi:hypothetical protein
LATGLGEAVGGALADDFGGLVSLQVALMPCALPPEFPLLLLPLPLEEQAASVSTTAEPSAAREYVVDVRMARAFPAGGIATSGEAAEVGCARNVCPLRLAQQGIHSLLAGSATLRVGRATDGDESEPAGRFFRRR